MGRFTYCDTYIQRYDYIDMRYPKRGCAIARYRDTQLGRWRGGGGGRIATDHCVRYRDTRIQRYATRYVGGGEGGRGLSSTLANYGNKRKTSTKQMLMDGWRNLYL